MSRSILDFALLAAWALPLPSLSATDSLSDLEREKNWADEIVDFLVTGEAV
jgi:hypothetical protein